MFNDKIKKMSPTAKLEKKDSVAIHYFILGAVYSYVNNNDDYFGVIELFGKKNTNWSNTPLDCIYKWHENEKKNTEAAHKAAGRDVGILLSNVIREDVRMYERKAIYGRALYRWADKN